MAARRMMLPDYGTVSMKGTQYYRTRVTDQQGRRVSLYARTREELYQKEQEAIQQIENKTYRRSTPTVEEYCEKWLLMQSAQIRMTTLIDYTSKVKNYIIKPLGDMHMGDVTADDIRLALLAASKKSASVYKSVNVLYKCIFTAAMESKIIDENPTIYLKKNVGGIPQKDRLPLTDEQVDKLLDAIYGLPPYVFVMLGLGMNNFINAQGFGSMGMITVLLGAVVNIILDPVFIFALGMGVQGAALATVISQFLSALWAVAFLCGKKTLLRLRPSSMRVRWKLVGEICALGLSGFIMSATNSAVQVVCNATLQRWGGDVYVGVMTVLNSVREITTTPVMGITNAAQPVIGFNFGAGEYKRVRSGIQFMSAVCVGYTAAVWLCLFLFPQAFIRLFTSDPALLAAGVPSMHVYFFGFFMMALQFAGQSTNTALGRARQAVFFSLLRKAVIVIPLTLWLPGRFGLGVNGVFLAEPISNFLGGGACFVTMLLTVWPDLKRRERLHASGARG